MLTMRRNKKSKLGNAILEMGLMAIPITTLLLGTTVVGLNLGKSVQAAQLNRDAAAMFVRGIDFSKDSSKDLLVRLSAGLGMTKTGGNGVVYLSRVTWLPASKCTALNLGNCNSNQHVITQRIIIGNANLRNSSIGTPNAVLIDSKGLIAEYMTQPSAVAALPWMQLADGEYAFIAESYFSSPQFAMPGFQTGSGVYTISMY